jgi:hypothetical protein
MLIEHSNLTPAVNIGVAWDMDKNFNIAKIIFAYFKAFR